MASCTCTVVADSPGACSCPATIIRGALGLAGWAIVPGRSTDLLSGAPCDSCGRTPEHNRRYREEAFSLTPTERTEAPTIGGTAASREAWAKAASPASRAAMAGIPTGGAA